MSSAFPRAVQGALAGAASCLWLTPAFPHAVCGDRVFPATLAIDDPGVGDELALPTVSWVPYNAGGSVEWDASFSWTKTITEGLSVVIGSGPSWTHPGGYGWNPLDTEIQYQLLCIPDAEFMAKIGFDVSWGGTGTGILAGSGRNNTYTPLVDAGLGFGTLPKSLEYFRPFAVTGEFSVSAPADGAPQGNPAVTFFNWGFTLQYSLPYFSSHVAAIDNEFWKHLIPVAEVNFQTPIHNGGLTGTVTTGTFQPGAVYITDKWQFALEAMIPVNGASGHGVGVIAQIDWYLDDIFPDTLGKPLFPHGFGIAPGL